MKKYRWISAAVAVSLALSTLTPIYAEGIVSENNIETTEEDTAEINTIAEDTPEEEIRKALFDIRDKNPILVLVYGVTECNILQGSEPGAAVVRTVCSGEQLSVKDFAIDQYGRVYYLIEGNDGNGFFRGYISGDFIVTNDAAFQEWKKNELSKIAADCIKTEGTTAAYITANFPQEYHNALIQLINAHPNWVFVAYNTRLDFNAVVGQERVGDRSLIEKNYSNDSWKSKDAGDYDAATGQYVIRSGSNWVRASQTGVSYCLNPVNYLDEQHIFAFEQLSFNASGHTIDGVRAIIRNTWMYNYGSGDRALEDGSGGAYSSVFMAAGQVTGVSPYHLASRVVQEQGVNGTALIFGVYPGYEGLYNYFNIQANGTGNAVITNGLTYARSQGWNSRYASIVGGAGYIGKSYISRGQDTLYFQKFDVESSDGSLYNHQYMQNILAPLSESVKVCKAYKESGAINNSFVFRIPVYQSLPISSDPGIDGFVTRLYQVVLDRQPDAGGLSYWKSQMKNGRSAADVALDFFRSNEMVNKNLDDSEFLNHAYRAVLGREADPSGKEYWMNELRTGCTRDFILRGFLHSPEFAGLCNSYGVTRGNIDARLSAVDLNVNQSKFVTRLYRNVLRREPDDPGRAYWVGRIDKGLTASKLVGEFVFSKEFTAANVSNEDYVEILYMTMMDRASDPAGKAYWVNLLNSGENRKTVLRGFLNSKEFNNICKNYRMTVGTL